MHSMVKKQLRLLGCPVPENCDADTLRRRPCQDGLQFRFDPAVDVLRKLRIYITCTDGGSDQVYARKLWAFETMDDLFTFFVDLNCLLHIGQLIVKSGLDRADVWMKRFNQRWKYFASVAKLINVWRDLARAVYVLWHRLYGFSSAQEHASQMPPKCIAGRWGKIWEVEQFVCARNTNGFLAIVLKGAIEKKIDITVALPDRDMAALHDVSIADIDDPRLEETDEFRRRMGRWRRDTLGLLDASLFWLLVRLMNAAHAPLMAHFHFMDKKRNQDEIEMKGTAVVQLICGRSTELLSGFDKIFNDTTFQEATFTDISDNAPLGMESDVIAFVVEIWCHHGCAYNRRIVKYLNQLLA